MRDPYAIQGLDSRPETHQGISVHVPTVIVKAAKELFAQADWVKSIPNHLLLRDDNQISVYFYELDEPSRDWVYQQMLDLGDKSAATTLASLREAEKDPNNIVIKDLTVFAQALSAYVRNDAIDGWLYGISEHGESLPWLVRNISLQEMSNGQECVMVALTANSVAMSNNDYSRPYDRTVFFLKTDLTRGTVAEILAIKGFMKETTALKQAYEASIETFTRYAPKVNEQFIARGSGLEVDLSKQYPSPERVPIPTPMRVVNDEDLVKRKFTTRADAPFWHYQRHSFSSIPIHPMILCFNLETHSNMWIHVDNMLEYQYDPSLRDKLILPPHHRDLIDILTQDMDVLMEDIIADKSGGTTILCKGAPGLGKTLTAEVYAEVVRRPLYRVHSGQLGINSAEVEKNLERILKRAQRWGAVLLIDEADVYIRTRGNDIDHNAVVASFLRTLEYFHGLLFMTTNRTQDVDDAIASRCIATIIYEPPRPEDAKRIWRVLSGQFEFTLDDPLIDDLVSHFHSVSGRDIKELLKLTAKWCRQKNVPPSLEVFRSCAQFRGL